jgi:hypothetical protein
MIEERSLEEIKDDVVVARVNGAKITWSATELACDMLVIAKQLQIDLEKFLLKSMQAPAKRVRTSSKLLETLGRSFRVQSVKEYKNGKN